MRDRRPLHVVRPDAPGAVRDALAGIASAAAAAGKHAEELIAGEQRKRRRRLRLEIALNIAGASFMAYFVVSGNHPAIAAAVGTANVLLAVRAMIRLGRRG